MAPKRNEPLALSRRAFTSTLAAGFAALARSATAATASTGPGPTAPPVPVAPIGLDSNENPYGPSPRALAAIARAQTARYPDAREQEVAAALARKHGVAPEQIVLGCGSGEILKMADGAFLGSDRTVVAATPTFEAVLGYAKTTQATAIQVPLTADHRHDLPRMAEACDARTGIVYVCNPNNPTGTIVSSDELRAFVARVPRSAMVLVDEAYHHFVEDARYRTALTLLPDNENVIVVRTFSKIYGLAGMRLGYAVATREKAEALRAHQIWSNANASVLDAALICLEDVDHETRQRDKMNGTKRWLVAELHREGRVTIPSEANFVMIDLGDDIGPVIEAFGARGVKVGRRFPGLPTWLRISIGTDEEMRTFLRILRELRPARAVA
jgi:histidinol-phosphate aminotransferase